MWVFSHRFSWFSMKTLGMFHVFPMRHWELSMFFHLPVVQPSPNLPRPVPAGCIAWQWPCWMKPKRISPQWWVYGEIHHVKIWVKIHEKKSDKYDEIWWTSEKSGSSCVMPWIPCRWNVIFLVWRTRKVSSNWTIGARRQGPQSCSMGGMPVGWWTQAAASCCHRRQWWGDTSLGGPFLITENPKGSHLGGRSQLWSLKSPGREKLPPDMDGSKGC